MSNAKVTLLIGDEIIPVLPGADGIASARDAAALPLLVRPGETARWGGACYRLEREGRYCFEQDGQMRNVIVFQHDFRVLFAALAQIHLKGLRHTELSVPERIEMARSGRLSVMCGGIVSVTLALLAEVGQRARRAVMTGPELTGAHVVMEYFDPESKRWVLVDIHNHAMVEAGGRPLSIAELRDAVSSGDEVQIRRLSRLGGIDYFSWQPNGTGQFGIGSELVIYDDAHAHAFFTAPDRLWGIYDGDIAYFPADSAEQAERISAAKVAWQALPSAEWKSRLYGTAE